MWTKHTFQRNTQGEQPVVYLLMALMWAVFVFTFYLLWQKAAM